jgi:CheY-like chemotaxis protein
MDGLHCTKQIRDWEEEGLLRRHVPIIAVTANARSEQITMLIAAGMVGATSFPLDDHH